VLVANTGYLYQQLVPVSGCSALVLLAHLESNSCFVAAFDIALLGYGHTQLLAKGQCLCNACTMPVVLFRPAVTAVQVSRGNIYADLIAVTCQDGLEAQKSNTALLIGSFRP
jgi:hypothetical protein